ncbi:hypothetical protein ACR9YC_13130 [Parasphingorhabdus sp. DH2-15]|uniref:hypothetical protein n=1 Tax=Parasphingorhabdus sp. DH2-15 TaxID=3444112 RepID=UPI003F6839BB
MKDRFTIFTFASGLIASIIGLTYLSASGAPQTMIIVNIAATLLGIILAIGAILSIRMTKRFAILAALIASLTLLATALFGYAIEDARRWILMGPFFVQTSLILLPSIALCFARSQNLWTLLAICAAGLAVAIQPDRAMAAMLSGTAIIICCKKASSMTITAAIFCSIAFMATLLQPDRLPAVPFVDHILWTAFDVHATLGLSLWFGCLIMICPVLLLPRANRTIVHYIFASSWLIIIASAALGAYPTPMLGYGASAIIGYFLSLIFVQPLTDAHSSTNSTAVNGEASGEIKEAESFGAKFELGAGLKPRSDRPEKNGGHGGIRTLEAP